MPPIIELYVYCDLLGTQGLYKSSPDKIYSTPGYSYSKSLLEGQLALGIQDLTGQVPGTMRMCVIHRYAYG